MRDLRFLVTLPGFPRRLLGRAVGGLARTRVPRSWRGWLWPWLARRFGIDPAQVPGTWQDYPCFLELFTRPLPEGARPLAPGTAWLSPADGVVLEHQPVTSEGSWLIKGVPYSTPELLPGTELRDWLGYQAVQLYLAPHDYHRYHAPCTLEVHEATSLEGGLQPVDPGLVRRSMRVLARNRRVFLSCRTPDGERVGLLYVAALNVGGMRFTFDASLGGTPFRNSHRRYDPPVQIGIGEEMGRFELGSTVVLFAPGQLDLLCEVGDPCRAREPLYAGGRETEK